MVKIKGFTLIEIMIVIAIVGILFSIIIGPNNSTYTNQSEWDSTDDSTMIINGIPHICDKFGECKRAN